LSLRFYLLAICAAYGLSQRQLAAAVGYLLLANGASAMKNPVTRFLKDESGVTAIEYGLIAALISVVIIGAAGLVGTQLAGVFTRISIQLAAAA
jgi:pilus assembly protein Flp/PilA